MCFFEGKEQIYRLKLVLKHILHGGLELWWVKEAFLV